MNTPTLRSDIDIHHEVTLRRVTRACAGFVAIIGVLFVVNMAVSPEDPGWLGLNPTPFLLVPAILGALYGFNAGLASGILSAGLIILARQTGTEIPAADHRFVLASLPLLGLIVGQLSETSRKQARRAEADCAGLEGENRSLRAERQLLFLSKQDLQQRLGLHGASSSSLDQDLGELASATPGSAPAILLRTLDHLTHVRSAAVYKVTDARSLELSRRAVIGTEDHFPEVLQGTEHHLLHESLTQGCFLAQKGLLQPTPARGPGFLLASPITAPDGEVQYVLIVQDLPFMSISRRNFSTVKAICDWFAAFVISPVSTPSHHKAISQTDFFKAIETAITTHTDHALPSTLVRIPFSGSPTAEVTAAFSEFLDILPAPALLTNAIENGQRSLLFLFPANSEHRISKSFREALDRFAERLGVPAPADPQFHLTQPGISPQQLWGQLVATA